MFELMRQHSATELHFCSDPSCGLNAVIAIHSVLRGPALGGCRFVEYDSSDCAVIDACQLARGMSYKAALADIPHGGGKAVIVKPKHFDENQRSALFQRFGEFVDNLNGRYITAVDSGTAADDMDNIQRTTAYVTSTTEAGDPSPYTARGVFAGVRAACKYQFGNDDLQGVHIAIAGLGHVGLTLARQLLAAGAQLTVADLDRNKLDQLSPHPQVRIADVDTIYATPCDVFSPCALGGAINPRSIERLRCKIIAGSANNQLADDALGLNLHQRGILYAPDFAINAGGLIYAALHHRRSPLDQIEQKVDAIAVTLGDIFQQSRATDTPTNQIANRLAEAKLYLNPAERLAHVNQLSSRRPHVNAIH